MSRLDKPLKIINLIAALSVIVGAVFYVMRPHVARMIWGDDFKDLMYECDHAMKQHYIAKRRVEVSPGEEAIRELDSTQLGLLVCHDYDKVSKKLEIWGLDKYDISDLGLEAIEEKNYEINKFVETHEFRY